MSIKGKALAVAASLTIAGGVITVSTPASAATPECGDDCISIFSRELGTHTEPNLVEAVLDGVARVGQPVILAPASSTDPAQDFLLRAKSVSDFYAAGMVSAEVNERFGSLLAAQIRYAPFGKPSGLCVGLAVTAFQNEGLTLQPCTTPHKTVWIIDTEGYPSDFFTIINASTTDFSRPFAMTYPRYQQAAPQRTQQITLRRLQFVSKEHTVLDRQLWSALFGVLA